MEASTVDTAPGSPESAPSTRLQRAEAWLDILLASRWTLPGVILFGPLLVSLIYSGANFPAQYDPWNYIAWARDFDYMTERWSQTYYFARFAYILPGRLAYWLLPDVPARIAWNLAFDYLLIASLAGVMHRLFGQRYAVLGTLLLATDVSTLYAFGGGPANGAAVAFTAAATYSTIRAADCLRPEATVTHPLAKATVWSFATGAMWGLAFWTYSTAVFWVILLPVLFLLRVRRPPVAGTALGIVATGAGLLVVTAFHALVFHHYTGGYEFWRGALDLVRAIQATGGWAIPASQVASDLLSGPWLLHLSAFIIVGALSFGVCGHALRHRRDLHDGAFIACALMATFASIQFLALTTTGSIYYVVSYQFLILVTVPALVGVAVYLRQITGSVLPDAVLVAGWLPAVILELLAPPRGRIWSLALDVTMNHAGLVIIVLSAAGTLTFLLFASRSRFARPTTFYVAALMIVALAMNLDMGSLLTGHSSLVSSSAVRGADLTGLSRSGGRREEVAEPRPRFESLVNSDRGFDAPAYYVATLRGVDYLRGVSRGERFGFVFKWLEDGYSGSLAGAIASNFLFEFSQITREWPELRCEAIKGYEGFVVAGTTWTQGRDAVGPLLACGAKPVFREGRLIQKSGQYVYLMYYDLPAGVSAGNIAPQQFSAINEASGSVRDGAFELTTDSRQYAFSAVAPLPAGITGPATIRVHLQVQNGAIGVLATRKEDPGDILDFVTAIPGKKTAVVDLVLPDIAATTGAVILRNQAPGGMRSQARIESVEVLQPLDHAVVPAAGLDLKLPNGLPVFKVETRSQREIISLPFIHRGTSPAAGKVYMRAQALGFDAEVVVLDANGSVLARKEVARGGSQALELNVADLSKADRVVIRKTEDRGQGTLTLESATIFAD